MRRRERLPRLPMGTLQLFCEAWRHGPRAVVPGSLPAARRRPAVGASGRRHRAPRAGAARAAHHAAGADPAPGI